MIHITKTPFVFTLYPGGGFWLNDPLINDKLKNIFNSSYFKKVITTQNITYNHILKNELITEEQVENIYGVVVHPEYFRNSIKKKYYKKDKFTFDICFVSYKYMEKGIDKGYDIFIEVCKKLAILTSDINFHVVGNYSESDIDVTSIKDRITFYGSQNSDFFQEFYSKMDIILSPNVPYVLVKGKNFDGFPTGCCIDAGLNGVGVFCTDELKENSTFVQGKEILILHRNIDNIISSIIYYYHTPKKLYKMSKRGKAKFSKVFDFQRQVEKRTAIFDQYM